MEFGNESGDCRAWIVDLSVTILWAMAEQTPLDYEPIPPNPPKRPPLPRRAWVWMFVSFIGLPVTLFLAARIAMLILWWPGDGGVVNFDVQTGHLVAPATQPATRP